jgi:hypothetical protein
MSHPSRLSLASHSRIKAIQSELLNLRSEDIIPPAVRDYLATGMLCLAEAFMEAELQELVGTRWAQYPGRELKRYGTRQGQICVLGRKRKVAAPRVRVIGGKELQLQTYYLLNDERLLTEAFAAAWVVSAEAEITASLIEAQLQDLDLKNMPAARLIRAGVQARQTFLASQQMQEQLVSIFIDQIELAQSSYIAAVAVDSERAFQVLALRSGILNNSNDCKTIVSTLLDHAHPESADGNEQNVFMIPDSSILRRTIRDFFPQANIHTCYDFGPEPTPSMKIEQEVAGNEAFSSVTEATLQQIKSWSEAL